MYARIGQHLWKAELGLDKAFHVDGLILNGVLDYLRDVSSKKRLLGAQNVRQLRFPQVIVWQADGLTIAYASAYGATMAAQFTHLAAMLGVDTVLATGSCGGLFRADVGTIVIPTRLTRGDRVSDAFCSSPHVNPSQELQELLSQSVASRGTMPVHGPIYTTSLLTTETPDMIRDLVSQGYLGVDMELACIGAVAGSFGMRFGCIAWVNDDLADGRTLLTGKSRAQKQRKRSAERSVFFAAVDAIKALAAAEAGGEA